MAGQKARRPELHDARPRREGHGHARKYAEDFRADGHAVRQAAAEPDAARARHAASTRARRWRCPASRRFSPPTTCRDLERRANAERALTNEPLYSGRADSRRRRRRRADGRRGDRADRDRFEPLPFVVDPLESLRPGRPERATRGQRLGRRRRRRRPAGRPRTAPPRETDEVDRRGLRRRRGRAACRWASAPDEWSYGDLDAGFKNAALVLDETFVAQSTGHQPLETRTAMAYWQNGKLFLHGSTQSAAQTRRHRRALGRHRRRRRSCSSASTPAAASAARAPAPSRWRFPRCCRRRRTRR